MMAFWCACCTPSQAWMKISKRAAMLSLIAILRIRQARHVLHDEVWLTLRCRPGVEHLGDARMIHDRDRLPLEYEALQHRRVVHASADQLESDLTVHWGDLIGQ